MNKKIFVEIDNDIDRVRKIEFLRMIIDDKLKFNNLLYLACFASLLKLSNDFQLSLEGVKFGSDISLHSKRVETNINLIHYFN